MGLDFVENSALAAKRYAQAESILGWSVADLSKLENSEKISITSYTQPALYVLSCIIAEHLLNEGFSPALTAGHSAGEYAALTCSGAWNFSTGLAVIAERGRLMQERSAPGSMAAVMGLTPEQLNEACTAWTDGFVGIANYNSPRQIVITGDSQAVNGIVPMLKEKGAKRVIVLPVKGAFHSPLMKDAQAEFDAFMKRIEIREPQIPWVSNNTAEPVTDPETIRLHLVKQFCEPVRWVQSVAVLEETCEEALEVGPGKVLQGLVKACSDRLICQTTSTYEQTVKLIESLYVPA